MKAVIIYQGKYGSTAQYAQWLAESLGLPLINSIAANTTTARHQDCLILGSSVYAGKRSLHRWPKQNLTWLADKKIFFFIVCGTTADNEQQQAAMIRYNIDPLIKANCDFTFLPGRLMPDRLNWTDRLMIKMGAWLESDREKKAAMGKGFDRVARKELDGLISKVGKAMTKKPL